MTGEDETLAALQLADGLFPAGGFALSNGLEQWARDGRPMIADVDGYARAELDGRFGPFDRVAMVLAHRRSNDINALAELDARVERMTWARSQRQASAAAGRGLMTAAARLGLPASGRALVALRSGRLTGHQALAMGVVFRDMGLGEATAQAVAGHRFLAGLMNAAVRLGLVGAIGAQGIQRALRPALIRWLQHPVPDTGPLRGFSPVADIAMMRHGTAEGRLFAV